MTDELERRLADAVPHGASVDLHHLRTTLARRAAKDGLLDVAYGTYDSPLGPLTVFVTRRGLVRLSYPGEPVDEQLNQLAALISPRVMAAPDRTDEVRRQLDAYFGGSRRAFELPIDWRLVRGFASNVLRATARIPFGSVSSYREVAIQAGSPNAYRAAGNALGSNPVPIVVPCHRVLHAGGGLGGYTGGLDRKRFLLRLEGVLEA
ncbi:MAG: methylated-DNA--[protein]-cysteine S-methyltransferase [Chloroflexi bacterium]|nr:methylated-DNA--[protein]-cysteine S-methyltransferase [Chloroflexota bacterium]